jgi:hypothetical protein
MSHSIRNSHVHGEKVKVPRFRRLDSNHISAIESLSRIFPFLKQRVEIHLPYHRAKQAFQSQAIWVWPKFDKRPVGYLIFFEEFGACIWYPDRQEGMTFNWILPPNFCRKGPVVCLANILPSESLLQIEDLLIYEGIDIWSNCSFSERWEQLLSMWKHLPQEQPLLAFQPRLVRPYTLDEWQLQYDPTIYWIIQPDHAKQPRWFWKDTTEKSRIQTPYIPPKMKRDPQLITFLCAQCIPSKLSLPDTYQLLAQDETVIGFASISNFELSRELREHFKTNDSLPVEVKWNEAFLKYQIVRKMPMNTPITTLSFFQITS